MDESFLSQKGVIEASRRFVCIRLATYEDAEEAKLLKSIFVGRTGELENTVFTMLSPDGKRNLVRPGRGPHFSFGGAASRAANQMAATMDRIAKSFQAKADDAATRNLPKLKDVRLGLNVAACDNQPLVVVIAKDTANQQQMESRLASFAWSNDFIGQFQYASSTNVADLKNLGETSEKTGYFVVQPNQFGSKGELLAELPANATDKELRDALNLSVVLHVKSTKSTRFHIQAGRENGINWKTEIPVTDPMSLQAQQRGPRR